ncbi:MAG TPA: hypothetical protein VE133_19250, partial [Candidatus Sulfotelmatobacter sp.]|nr:hypothetical protein [Candidatus Sulfotelmatobacter sp.]
MSKLSQSGKTGHRTPSDQCPPPSIWGAVAAGMVPQQDAFKYLEHSGACATCAEELQSALYALDENAPMPAAIQSNLETASEAWQKSFAARLESQTSAAPIRSSTSTRQNLLRQLISRPWAIAAVAAIVLLTIGLGIFSSQRRGSPDTLIRQAYTQQRTIEMRIPGADYGPVQVERASGSSSISSPRPLLEAQVQ